MYQPDWKACFSFLVIAYLSIVIQPEKAAKFDSTKRDRVHCVRVSCVCVPGRDLAGSASALSLRQVTTVVVLCNTHVFYGPVLNMVLMLLTRLF
jgi:hypothetical protein